MTRDPLGLYGGWNGYYYVGNNPIRRLDPYGLAWYDYTDKFFDLISPKDENGMPLEPPQWLVDSSAGFGDGVVSTMSLGFLDGQDLRDSLGIDGGIDKCSGYYRGGRIAGTATVLAVNAYGAIPKTLTHFTTTQARALSIMRNGLNPSSRGFFGAGRYAATKPFPYSFFVPPGSKVPVIINNTSGFIRALVPGNFIQPVGGSRGGMLFLWNAIYGGFANRHYIDDTISDEITGRCGCE